MTWDKTKDELRQETIRQTNKRKKTGKWCRGKVGVPHVSEIVVNHNYSAGLQVCEWRQSYLRRGGVVQVWRWYYSCVHALRCTNCGKYVEWRVEPEQCPVFVPKPE